jgi:hypothetical protein
MIVKRSVVPIHVIQLSLKGAIGAFVHMEFR